MTKRTAIVLAAITLAACSDEEPTKNTSEGASQNVEQPNSSSMEARAGSSVAPCPTETATNAPAGSKQLPNLVERCEGAYECDKSGYSKPVTEWFRFDSSGNCIFGGGNEIFRADGSTTSVGATNTGEWSGDYTTFRWSRGVISEWCTRIANE